MKAPPAFQLYAADFDIDTNTWDLEPIGLYLRLLLSQWVNGSIPDDPIKLAKIARISPKKLSNLIQIVSHKFVSDGNGNLINLRLEKERQKQINYRESQKESGVKGAKKRWDTDKVAYSQPYRVAHGDPNGKPNGENMALQSSDFSHIVSTNVDTCPHQQIIALYHEILPECPQVKKWTPSRQAKLRARWREDKKHQSLDFWKKYFENVRLCFWFIGKNERNWYPDLEWLIEQSHFISVWEKKYLDRGDER